MCGSRPWDRAAVLHINSIFGVNRQFPTSCLKVYIRDLEPDIGKTVNMHKNE